MREAVPTLLPYTVKAYVEATEILRRALLSEETFNIAVPKFAILHVFRHVPMYTNIYLLIIFGSC
jgi:hypothetical protein